MRHNKRSKKPLIITLVTIIVILMLGVVFFFPLNNAIRNVTGNDTASDKVVKLELVKKVKSKKNGDATKDKKIDRAASILGKKKMSQIMSAANDQDKAANLIADSSSLSKEQAQKAAQKIFSDDSYSGLRKAISDGNWYQAYQQYQKLSNDGQLTQLQQDIAK